MPSPKIMLSSETALPAQYISELEDHDNDTKDTYPNNDKKEK